MNPGWSWSSQTWPSPRAHARHRPHARTNGVVTRSPTFHRGHLRPGLDDGAGQLVAGHVWELDPVVVAHPAVPVAAAQSGRLDGDDHPVGRTPGVFGLGQFRWCAEPVIITARMRSRPRSVR